MRADRLLSLLMLLQTRGRMTARDLAERLEVSERTRCGNSSPKLKTSWFSCRRE